MILYIILLSIIIQLLSAILAIRLIKHSNHSKAWLLVSFALMLMAARRVIVIGVAESNDVLYWLNILEIVGLAISILMLLGMINIKTLFDSLNEYSKKQERLTEILEFTSDVVITVDLSYRIIYLNRTAQNLFAISDNYTNLTLFDIHPDYRVKEIIDEYLPYSIQNGIWKGENIIRRSDGTEFYVSQVIFPHLDSNGNVYQYSTIARDITLRKENENRLIELNKTKDKFFSIIAHDLKSPIGAVKAAVEMLVDDFDSFTKEEILELLDNMKISISNDYNLLENLLHWSRMQIGSKSIEKIKIDLKYIADNSAMFLMPIAEKKLIEIISEIPNNLFINADINIVQLVFRNIISNAIKFSKIGGKVIMSTEEKEYTIVISIRDFGVGISKDKIKEVLDKNSNYSSLGTANESGTGLGINLCSEFIAKHSNLVYKCELWIESEQNVGTTVKFSLPKYIPEHI